MCLFLASSWVKMPWLVEMTKCPNCLDGRMLLVHFSKSSRVKSYLGEMTPHLLTRPINSMTIFLDLWSSMISNSPMQPLACIILRNWMTSLETGRMRTCFFPFLSALTIVLRQSESTFIFTIGDNKLIFQYNVKILLINIFSVKSFAHEPLFNPHSIIHSFPRFHPPNSSPLLFRLASGKNTLGIVLGCSGGQIRAYFSLIGRRPSLKPGRNQD